MRKQMLSRRPQFEVLEDRLALNATMIPQVQLGPSISLEAATAPPVISLQGSFIDPEINVFDHASAKFLLTKSSDGTLVQFGVATVDSLRRTISYELTPPAPGNYMIEVDMTYGGLTGIGTTALFMLPSLQQTTPIVEAGPDVSVTEGAQPTGIHMFGTFSDPSATYLSYLSARYFVIRSDGSLEQTGPVNVDIQRRTLIYDILQVPAGEYTVKLQLTDRLFTGEGITHLHVWPNYPPPAPIPQAPVVVAPLDGAIKEGGVYTGTYSFSDPDGGPWNVRIDFGNGSAPVVLNNVQHTGAFNLSAVYVRNSVAQPNGVYHGTVTVTDSTGLSSKASFSVLVRAETPVLHAPATVVSNRYGMYTPVTVSYSETSTAGRLSAFFLVRNQRGQIVEAGSGTINPRTHKVVFVLRLLPPGKYTVEFYMNHDGAIGHTQSNLQELPFLNPRLYNILFALYGRGR